MNSAVGTNFKVFFFLLKKVLVGPINSEWGPLKKKIHYWETHKTRFLNVHQVLAREYY